MRKQAMILCVVLFTFVLAGCSNSGGTTIALNMREFSFSPESFSVAAGSEVTLNLKNLGALDHNFHIMKMDAEVEEKWEDSDEAGILLDGEMLDGGGSAAFVFTAPMEPGTYQIVCSVPGHFQQGMIGTMTVTAP